MDPVTANGRDDLFLLDVRDPQEWHAGHVRGSTHIPMADLGARQAELPTDRPILCICRSGQRSAMVTGALERAGYEAHNLEGGLLAWVEARLPLVTDNGEDGTVV
jgi:rhodanese-related sulfurtransferase